MSNLAQLKAAVEQAKTQVTRLEIQHETAEKELAVARPQLKELAALAGVPYDEEAGTVSADAIAARRDELAEEGASILADLAAVKAEAGL